jgi:hypothetical protein
VTVGIKDMLISKKAKEEMNAITSQLMIDSQHITDRYLNGELVPSMTQTMEEFYEEK